MSRKWWARRKTIPKRKFLGRIPLRPKLLQTNATKQSLYKAHFFACSLANRDKPVAATLQRKCSAGIIFVIITKIITTIIVGRPRPKLRSEKLWAEFSFPITYDDPASQQSRQCIHPPLPLECRESFWFPLSRGKISYCGGGRTLLVRRDEKEFEGPKVQK